VGSLWAVVAAISPDEEQLALVERNSILIVRRDGSKVRELTSLPRVTGLSGRIDWAPDGRRLRFDAVRAEGGEPWIWEVPVEGGSARPLWPGARGRWTKDGRYFVFQRWSRPEARGDLYAVREPRFRWLPLSAPVRLTVGPVSFSDVGPAPGDRRLLAWGTTNRGELLRFDAKTGRFESYLGGASAYYVSSSSDGQWLAWVSYPDGALWRSRPDGTERLRLTAPGWEAHLPRWSPDGRSLVFAGKGPTEGLLGIVRTSADASETEVLARSDTDADLWDPCWLPDGRTILYSHRSSARLGIYRLDLQTRTRSLLPGAEELRFPKCSSRGDVLAMGKSSVGVGPPYWIFRADQGTWEPLGRLPLAHPTWLPDGQSFIGLDYLAMRLERWSRATRRLEPFADLRDLPLVAWVDNPWMGLGPDGSPLVMRNRSTRDLYALDWEAP
jgi:Tol biopolymer transport system component